MSIRGLKKWALLLTFWVALQGKLLRATPITGDTVTGNFTATGNADIQGDTLSLGTRTDNSNPGWLTFYTDGTISSLEFDASRSGNIWKWQQNGNTSLQTQMSLDNNNNLVIYSPGSSPTARITLNPLGTSTFANSVTLNGTNNQMPNQTLTGSGSVITERLGDSRYAPLSSFSIGSVSGTYGVTGPTLGVNGGRATGPDSFAEGNGSTASGNYSTAMGDGAYATGNYSTATGIFTTASGYASFAQGEDSTASGYDSVAMGQHSTASRGNSIAMGSSSAYGAGSVALGVGIASGNYSTALGSSRASGDYSTAVGGATASGYGSTAMGNGSTANAFDSVAMGRWNVGAFASGGNTAWIATDPLLELGNGTGPNAKSDALIVYKNGNVAAQGVITAQPSGDIPMYAGN